MTISREHHIVELIINGDETSILLPFDFHVSIPVVLIDFGIKHNNATFYNFLHKIGRR